MWIRSRQIKLPAKSKITELTAASAAARTTHVQMQSGSSATARPIPPQLLSATALLLKQLVWDRLSSYQKTGLLIGIQRRAMLHGACIPIRRQETARSLWAMLL